MAAVGDIRRFRSPRKLVGYLGLDPKVRQSGPGPASHGRISKQGSAPARYALVEAAWSVVRQPGPLHAFYERIRSRRRHQVAIVATARKLACLFWQLLTKEEDFAYSQPSLTKKKLRRLELLAGAPKGEGGTAVWSTNKAMRQAERALAEQAERAYERTVRDWQAQAPKKNGAGARPGRHRAGRWIPAPPIAHVASRPAGYARPRRSLLEPCRRASDLIVQDAGRSVQPRLCSLL
jgi:hypothetical protein